MKTLTMIFLLLTAIFCNCKNDSDQVKKFDSMHFIRQGGGQIEFKIHTTDSTDKVKVIVSEYNFRDTTIQLIIESNADNAAAFLSFHKAINNQTQLNGDFKQSTLETGSWSYIYFVSCNGETEVTNTELRNSLLKFEELTRLMINK
jgi:hypothetical protein